MIQNYFILASLIGIYSMVKTNDPVVILVVGILAMFSFTIGFSNRLELSKFQKTSLWVVRGRKSYFAFLIGFFPAVVMSNFLGPLGLLLGFFITYQIASFVSRNSPRRYQINPTFHF
jgi:hypothetical protein